MRKVLLFGGLGLAWIVVAVLIVLWLLPGSAERGPALVAVPPLEPISRTSSVVAPAAIALAAVRAAMEQAAPRSLPGRKETPLAGVLGTGAELTWTIDRGALALAGRNEALTVSAPLTGALRATGQFAGVGSAQGGQQGPLGGLGAALGGNLGRQLQQLGGAFDQKADIKGSISVTARPRLSAGWRIEPNLTGSVTITDVSMPIGPVRLNVAREVKPFVDRAVADQIAAAEARVRADPFLEQTARREWGRLCRSIPLAAAAGAAPAAPNLWLEVVPTRAFAAQPRVDAANVNLVFGVEAQTRIVGTETKPECPFPPRLELVPALQQGTIAIGVPIDMPFTEVNRLLDAQLAGKTFGEGGGSAVAVTVERARLAASGDRLLISLRVSAKEQRFLGFGADATVHVWGRPELDAAAQVLRLTDLALDVDSEAAFGVLGAAARAAVPYLLPALTEQARIDLKPFAADARAKVDAALADFKRRSDGVELDAAVTDLRLVAVAFDSGTLRVVAEADGTLTVAVTALTVP